MFRASDAWHTVDPKELFAMSQNNRPGFVGPEPSINFALISRHITDYNVISNCKSVHCNELFAMKKNNRNGQADESVCDIRHTVHSD